jgi:hypothetical protein
MRTLSLVRRKEFPFFWRNVLHSSVFGIYLDHLALNPEAIWVSNSAWIAGVAPQMPTDLPPTAIADSPSRSVLLAGSPTYAYVDPTFADAVLDRLVQNACLHRTLA